MRGLLCALILAQYFGAAVAYANPHPNSDPPPELGLDPVVIYDDQQQVPQADTTSTRSVIAPSTQLPTSLGVAGLLRGIPGIQTRGTGNGNGHPAGISVRGTDNQQTLVLLDDVPLNPSIGGGVDFSMLPLISMEKIEVFRGGSAIFGANAVGGALRFSSYVPSKDRLVRVSAGGGSFGAAFITGLVHGKVSPVGWVGAVTLSQSDGEFPFIDSNGNERVQQNNGVRSGHGSLRVSLEDTPGQIFSVINHFSSSKRGSPGVEQFPSRMANQENVNNVLLLRAESLQAGHPDLAQTSQIWHRFDRFQFKDPAPFFPPAIHNVTLSHAVGAFTQWDAYINSTWLLQGRLEGAVEWADVSRSGSEQKPSRTTGGLVIVNEINLLESRFRVVITGRLDLAEGFSPVPLGKLGIVTSPYKSLTFTANAGRAYRIPSFSELYFDSGNLRGNPSLGPEQAWSFDVGAEWSTTGASFRTTGFFIDIQNLILFLPKSAFVIEADDSKHARSLGIEAELELHPWPFLQWRSTYTLTDARFVDTGLRLPARSTHQVYSKVTVTHPYIEASVDAHWQSDMTLDRFEQLREEGRWMLGISIVGHPTPWLSTSVSAHNLLNKQDAVDSLQQPLSGLSVSGALTFTM